MNSIRDEIRAVFGQVANEIGYSISCQIRDLILIKVQRTIHTQITDQIRDNVIMHAFVNIL